MILGMGPMELIVILVVVLVIFGPKNLPKIGSALGKTVKNVREGMEGDDDKKDEKKSKSADDDDEAVEVIADDDDADADDSASDDAQFCGECGAKNPAGAGFCSKCGHKLGE